MAKTAILNSFHQKVIREQLWVIADWAS